MKCKAPYGSTWSGTGYHNAMVCSAYRSNVEAIKDIHDIKVCLLLILLNSNLSYTRCIFLLFFSILN